MIRHILALLLLIAPALLVQDYQDASAGQSGKEDSKNPALKLLGVTITTVKDLDQIEGFVRSNPKRKVRISLANTLPYSRWPEKLSQEQTKIKEAGLKLLREMIILKEDALEPIVFWGIDNGQTLHGDFVCRAADGPYGWHANLPSGKLGLGWFFIHINAMLIENGYSVYSHDPKELTITVTERPGVDRAKLLMAAESYAKEKNKGVWSLRDDGDFAKKLKALSKPER